MPKRVAIFLDYENLYIGWQQKTGLRGINLSVFEAIAEQYGQVVVRRAYDNWSQDRQNMRPELLSMGYHCEDVQTNVAENARLSRIKAASWRRKNMADVALTTDMMLAAGRNYADVFVIGSGDGTFAYLARKLMEPLEKQVVFVSLPDSTSRLITELGCDLHYYDTWLTNAREHALQPKIDPTDTFAADLTELLKLIDTLRKHQLSSPTPLVALLASQMLKGINFEALLERARIRGEIIVEEEGGQQYIYLPDEVLKNRRPPIQPKVNLRVSLVVLLNQLGPQPMKELDATLRSQREKLVGDPSNRDIQTLLAELKERTLMIEQRSGKRPVSFRLHPTTLIRWLAES